MRRNIYNLKYPLFCLFKVKMGRYGKRLEREEEEEEHEGDERQLG
jgi:hypothetical protein